MTAAGGRRGPRRRSQRAPAELSALLNNKAIGGRGGVNAAHGLTAMVPTQLNRLSPAGNADTPLSPPHIMLVSSCCSRFVTAMVLAMVLLSRWTLPGPSGEGTVAFMLGQGSSLCGGLGGLTSYRLYFFNLFGVAFALFREEQSSTVLLEDLPAALPPARPGRPLCP